MTRLDELLIALTTVIVRYHDYHESKKLVSGNDSYHSGEKSRKFVAANYESNNFTTTLEIWIKAISSRNPARAPFYNFLLHEITFLRQLRNNKKPLSDNDFESCKQRIGQLFLDCKHLITTSKERVYEVHSCAFPVTKASKKHGLYGLEATDSGNFLKDELFTRFNLRIDDANVHLQNFAATVSKEYQDAALASDLQQQLAALKMEITKQSDTINSLTADKIKDKAEIDKKTEQVAALLSNNEKLDALKRDLESEIKYKRQELLEIQQSKNQLVKEKERRNSDAESEIVSLKEKLKKTLEANEELRSKNLELTNTVNEFKLTNTCLQASSATRDLKSKPSGNGLGLAGIFHDPLQRARLNGTSSMHNIKTDGSSSSSHKTKSNDLDIESGYSF